MAMVKAQIYIEKEDLFDLKQYAREKGTSYSEVIRNTIKKLVDRSKKRKKKKNYWIKEMNEVASDWGVTHIDIDEELYGSGYKNN